MISIKKSSKYVLEISFIIKVDQIHNRSLKTKNEKRGKKVTKNRTTHFMSTENEISFNDYLFSLCIMLEEAEIEKNNAAVTSETAA